LPKPNRGDKLAFHPSDQAVPTCTASIGLKVAVKGSGVVVEGNSKSFLRTAPASYVREGNPTKNTASSAPGGTVHRSFSLAATIVSSFPRKFSVRLMYADQDDLVLGHGSTRGGSASDRPVGCARTVPCSSSQPFSTPLHSRQPRGARSL
jgi:hypothetical protein